MTVAASAVRACCTVKPPDLIFLRQYYSDDDSMRKKHRNREPTNGLEIQPQEIPVRKKKRSYAYVVLDWDWIESQERCKVLGMIMRSQLSYDLSISVDLKLSRSDVKDQAEDKANPKPWYTADEKSSKMSTEDLLELIREYPLPEGWYARLPALQEPANYGTKFETGIYEEQVKSGYRLPLHPFSLHFFEHYQMAPGQLVPNGWRKLAGLIYLELPTVRDDEPLSEEQLEWAKIIPPKPIPAGLLIPPHPPAIPSVSYAETIPLGVLCIRH
ncbi:hypothetical protein RJ640_003212 [Escallonia rubra]|uniref:Transposase (putative) gypsy type domain-containing protein n=1 Tax=Escallonia rubra TaxID=112253 RepID=A0AA88R4P8_9ASTE|nr:hypothetical protein RJ640_003212 [Escallonia rubra]